MKADLILKETNETIATDLDINESQTEQNGRLLDICKFKVPANITVSIVKEFKLDFEDGTSRDLGLTKISFDGFTADASTVDKSLKTLQILEGMMSPLPPKK